MPQSQKKKKKKKPLTDEKGIRPRFFGKTCNINTIVLVILGSDVEKLQVDAQPQRDGLMTLYLKKTSALSTDALRHTGSIPIPRRGFEE